MKTNFFKHTVNVCLLAIFAFTLGCCNSQRLIPQPVPDPLPPFYVPTNIRVALVLGSGGVRGIAHIGVIEELAAAGIPIDLIVGCSAGSIVGAFYADKMCIQATKNAVWNIHSSSMLDFDIWNCRYGLYQGRSMYQIFDRHLNAHSFEQLKVPLVVVASDLHSGELVPIGSGDLVQAIRASSSIPFVFVPCKYKGRVLVDGSVIDPVPVKVASDLGAQIVIAVDLCELLENTVPTNLFSTAVRSLEIICMWQNEVCTRNADAIIRPKTCGVGAFNDDMKQQVYEAGRKAAREKIPEIKELLASLSKDDCVWAGTRKIVPKCYTPQIYLKDQVPLEKSEPTP
jgi:NTE family protein